MRLLDLATPLPPEATGMTAAADRAAPVEQLPPADVPAEQSVLGSMLLSRAAIDDVLQQLEPRDFYRPAHADVFAAIVDLHHRGDPADAVTVGHELDSRGQLARVGGLPYLHTLIASVSTPASAAFHAEIVAAQARKRRAIEELTLALQRVRQAGTGFDDVDDLVADAAAKLAAGSTLRDRPATSWAAVDLTAVLDGTYRPAQPTVSRRADGVGLFYPGRVHSVSAESEAGKSWFALLAARIELDRGHSVVYLDFEDDEGGVVGRLLALGADPDAIRHGFAYVRPMEAINVGRNRAILADLLEHFDPTLVVLDGVTEAMTLHGMELIDNGDIARFGAMLPRWIADRGPAVVDLDHVTKDREGRGRYSIGGQHKLAGLNGAAYVLENRTPFGIGVTGRSTVYVAKDRPAQLRQHALPARDGLHWFADLTLESVVVDGRPVLDASLVSPHHRGEELSTFRPTALMAKVAAALAGAPRPLSKTEITDRVRGRRAADTRAALAALVDEGFVVEEDGPRGAKNHRLVKPFEESAA